MSLPYMRQRSFAGLHRDYEHQNQTYLEFALQSFSPIPGDCLFHSSKHFRSRRHSYDSQEETTGVRLRRGLLGRPRGDLVTKDDEARRSQRRGERKAGTDHAFPIPRPSHTSHSPQKKFLTTVHHEIQKTPSDTVATTPSTWPRSSVHCSAHATA